MMQLSQLRLLGLFDKRFEGDDALLRLASLRFKQAGLGSEFYAEIPDRLDHLLSYKYSENGISTVHLSREIDLLKEEGRNCVLEFAARFRRRIYGFIIHDQPEIANKFTSYVDALREMESRLQETNDSPYIFIEYASGLDPVMYTDLLGAIHDLEHISACIDTGHVGLWQAKTFFSNKHPGKNIFRLKSNPAYIPEIIDDIQDAVGSSLGAVLQMIEDLSRMKKPIHFHLHDGHPLSTFSFYGVSDHLSFLTEIPIPFEYRGRELLHPMYGPSGLSRIVANALRFHGPERVSLSLEIHPTEGRLPLGDASGLFSEWQDKVNAERTNYWLSVLLANHLLLSEYAAEALSRDSMQPL